MKTDPSFLATRGRSKNEAEAIRSAKSTQAHQDLGQGEYDRRYSLINWERRGKAKDDLAYHLKTYHEDLFYLPWAGYHKRLIRLAEIVVMEGGWFAFAVPRSGGKSKIAEGCVEWATLHGHKCWPVLVGANGKLAIERLSNIKIQLRNNPLLLEHFPEVCFPISRLGRSARKAEGQHICGRLTAMKWSKEEIVFPTCDRSQVAGSRITAIGITGSLRGMSVTTEEGRPIRPDLAIPAAPQTRESSKSYQQSQYRSQIIKGDIAWLNGPEVPMSVLVPCTVIYQGDLADQMTNRQINPEFRGERHKMVESFPTNMILWDQYAELVRECLIDDINLDAKIGEENIDRASQFYVDNREKMDEGAKLSWEDRKGNRDRSALQSAMNLKIRDEESFWAEGQNEPASTNDDDTTICRVEDIIKKQSHLESQLPLHTNKIICHIDVQQKLFYFSVVAMSKDFQGSVVSYGSSPDQHRHYFHLREDLVGLKNLYPEETRLETRIYKGLRELLDVLGAAVFTREDGLEMSIDLMLIDSSGRWSSTINRVCRETPYRSRVLSCKGLGVRAKDRKFAEHKVKANEQKGHHWLRLRVPEVASQQYFRHDTNYWKSQVHLGFATDTGSSGSLDLFKARPERHRMIAEHCNGQRCVRVKAKGNELDEWDQLPGKPDDHLFDTLAAALAGASYLGCRLASAHDRIKTGRIPKKVTTKVAAKAFGL